MGVRKQKYEAPRRRFPAGANVTVTAVQERSLGCAFDDDTGNGESKFKNEDKKPRVTRRLEDIRLPYRHFERSEKSSLQAGKRCMCETGMSGW